METYHKLIIGDSQKMKEIKSESVHLIVTSPPYFNAPFDFQNLYKNYNQYLRVLKNFSKESFRVLAQGRIATVNIDDMLVCGERFPIVADITKIFINSGFRYRDRIIWKKPDGYVRISRRSGQIIQNPYPMYFYPDNLVETVLIFQKGKFNYKSVDSLAKNKSRIDEREFMNDKWYRTLWEIVNVSPKSIFEKDIAAFPEELAYRLITLFSYKGETILDPFVGSGTTMKVSRELGRNSVGVEIKKELINIIEEKLSFDERLSIVYR
ncbi:site-specific DNA-methyltransferase [Candidatus Woesebacteria bacterium]|nr:site-specific DNA-methyltransferase [Candidatus Woesebacteria bacterium]QQG47813.1 MAG: site-specific DNA-methyltransferase [Candidatus Woesebacteria bacterium]